MIVGNKCEVNAYKIWSYERQVSTALYGQRKVIAAHKLRGEFGVGTSSRFKKLPEIDVQIGWNIKQV